ncbi:MAG: thermonuclease family protein [Candidatus Magasanikbacteria bacterium]
MLKRIQTILVLTMAVFALAGFKTTVIAATNKAPTVKETGTVYYVTDGDTFKVKVNGKNMTIRMIGTDTPEIKDPRKAVQCFGAEASKHTKELLLNKKVVLEGDTTTGNKDKYSRYLRYVYLEDGTNVNKQLISDGYAYAYAVSNYSYKQKKDFRQAELDAKNNKRGLWADTACKGVATPVVSNTSKATTTTKTNITPVVSQTTGCVIKGNISGKEKIYHLPGCQSYKQTIIDEKAGEKWFCTEDEAVKAGWRKAKNC